MLVGSLQLLVIISITPATPRISKYLNSKEMNIALRAVSNVDEKVNSEVGTSSDNIQKLVNEVKNKFYRGNQDATIAVSNSYKGTITFSDFIQEVINVLNKFDDTDIENFFSIANAEIKQYHYRGCKFHELTENVEFRKHIAKILEENKRKAATDIRNHLQTLSEGLKDENSNLYIKKIVDSINSLYKDESVDKYNKFLTNLDNYRLKTRRDMDLVKIIRAGLRSIIFDYYSNLDYQMRSEFQTKVNNFWTDYIRTSLPLVNKFTNELINDFNKKERNKSTVNEKTTKILKKKSNNLPSRNNKKSNVKEQHALKYNAGAYNRARQIDDVDDSKHTVVKSLKIKRSKGSQIPWDEFEHTYDAVYEPDPSGSSHHTVMEVITMRPYVSKRAMTSQKFKYEILFKHDIREPKLHLKKPEFQIKHRIHIRKSNGPMEIIPPVFSESSTLYQYKKKEKTRSIKKTTKRIIKLPSTTRKYKKAPRANSVVFNDKVLVQNRRNFANVSVFKRIQHLEDALRLAHTQIRNDSEIIKDLNTMLANQRIDYNYKYKARGNNDKPASEEKKNIVIDLKINFEDLKKLVSIPFNEIKQEELKTALFNKMNIENHDNTDSNASKRNMARKFDFDEHIYSSSRLNKCYSKKGQFSKECNEYTSNKGEVIESSLSKRKNNTEKDLLGYLSDGDTYERIEDRIYESDSNKGKVYNSDKGKSIQKVNNLNKYEEVTVSPERKTTIAVYKQMMNQNEKENYQNINSYMLQNKMETHTDEKNQNVISSDDELDEVERPDYGVKIKNNSDLELEKNVKDKSFDTTIDTRLYDKDSNENKNQKDNENSSDRENDNIYKNGIESVLNFSQITHDKTYKTDNNSPIDHYSKSHINNNVETKNKNREATKHYLDSDFKMNDKTVDIYQTKESPTTESILTTDLQTTSKQDDVEIKIENENAKFVRTEGPSGFHPKRFSTTSPKANKLIGTTDALTIFPKKILKFAPRIP